MQTDADRWAAAPLSAADIELLELVPDATLLIDHSGVVAHANSRAALLFGRPPDELVGVAVEELVPEQHQGSHPSLRATFHPDRGQRIVGGGRALVARRADGFEIPVEIGLSPVVRHGRTYVFAAIRDVEERERTRAEERLRDEQLQRFFEDAPIAMAVVDGGPSREVLDVNDALCELLGHAPSHLVGHAFVELVHPSDRDRAVSAIADLEDRATPHGRVELRLLCATGTHVWAQVSVSLSPAGQHTEQLIIQFEDITARREAELRLSHLALHDDLTDLPNRALLLDRLRQAQDRTVRSGRRLAVLVLDLDRFESINDAHGHEVGDQVLQVVAARVAEVLRPEDSVCRLGGDEFVVLCEDLDPDPGLAARSARAVGDRIRAVLRESIDVSGTVAHVDVSIGLRLVSGNQQTPASVLRDAEASRYEAKARGRGRTTTFNVSLRMPAVEHQQVEVDLRLALDRDEFELHHQPIIDLRAERPRGFEALVRWRHPTRGLLAPREFLSIVEETGLIVPMGELVIRKAFADLLVLRADHDDEDLFVSVNVSPLQLSRSAFTTIVAEAAAETGIRVDALQIELTETEVLHANQSLRARLRELSDAGARVGLDDFGTGYASLDTLCNLPLRFLKVDAGFVHRMQTHRPETAIVRSLIRLGHSLDFDVIAEGVETDPQLETLQEAGCLNAQGYLLGGPAPVRQTGTST